MTSFAALAAALAVSFSSQDPSAAPQDPDEGVEVDAIVVEGRTQERVNAFIDEVAAAPPGARLARWDREICVGAANMRAGFAQALVDHVSQVAIDVGLDIGEPGCRADILIVASEDGAAMAKELVEGNPRGFRPALHRTDLGSAALERFQTTDAPVRWWHVSLPVNVDTGEVAIRLDGEPPPQITVRDASRLRSNVREDLARVVIIMDVPKLAGVNVRALGDYIAMVALAQIDPGADVTGYNSVLNLFGADSGIDAMTSWDRDYLTSLYAANRDRARSSQQQREIAEGMRNPASQGED